MGRAGNRQRKNACGKIAVERDSNNVREKYQVRTGEKLLDMINDPSDLRKLGIADLVCLAAEIRQFLKEKLSRTGGHLASNLGVVELTIALHRVFETPSDKIIWDVGHQTYTHKILTGRKNGFDRLRTKEGISGFPKTEESCHDCFNTGHSSTSISAALGMARARDIFGGKYKVIAVIGDGAMTAGMAFEALNDAGHSRNDIIVILNDNGMSISKNTGALSRYLRKMRMMPIYNRAKGKVDSLLKKIPGIGRPLLRWISKMSDLLKQILLPGMLFEELGFRYFGPVDGHDMGELVHVMEGAAHIKGPVLIHVFTVKGKGVPYAEKNPHTYHSVKSFDMDTGEPDKAPEETFGSVFSRCIAEIGGRDRRVAGVTAAMMDGTGMDTFSRKYPGRFFDVGIAEQHAVTMAAGLAARGMIPVVSIYSSFLQRAYDQVLHDVALQDLHVVFAVNNAGATGEDGETHQGIYDLSYLRHIPNMTIAAPADYREMEAMMEFSVFTHKGPIAIRYPKGGGPGDLTGLTCRIITGRGILMKEGTDVTIIAVGTPVKAAAEAAGMLAAEGISAEIINARFIKPVDEDLIVKSLRKTGKAVFIEDNTVIGGFGCAGLEVISRHGLSAKVLLIGYPDKIITHAKRSEILKQYGLDADSIKNAVAEFVAGSKKE